MKIAEGYIEEVLLKEKMFEFQYKTKTGMISYCFIFLLKKSEEYFTFLGFRNLRKVYENIYTSSA